MGDLAKRIPALTLAALLIITMSGCYEFETTNTTSYTPRSAPPEVKSLHAIQVCEVFDRINKGLPVEYDHVLIKGNLNMSQLNLPITQVVYLNYNQGYRGNATLVQFPINITNSIIEGNVDLRKTIFTELVNFNNTLFDGTVDFSYSKFSKDAYFRESKFNETADFSEVRFNETVDFQQSQFEEYADFIRIQFNATTYFGLSQFTRTADFRSSQFNDTAEFRESKFYRDALFSDSSFNNITEFTRSQFNGVADFARSNFENTAYFSDIKFNDSDFSLAQFNGNVQFRYSRFSRDADFSASRFIKDAGFESIMFNGNADFSASRFTKDADFEGTVFNRNAQFKGTNFLGILRLTGIKFSRIDLYWPNVNRLSCNDGPTYLTLIQNFRNLEQFGAADDIYYQYRNWRRDQNSGWTKLSDYLAWISCGYGIKPERPVICALITLFLFGVLYFIGYRHQGATIAASLDILNESLAFSAVALFSLPKELFPHGEKKYAKLVRQNILRIPFRLIIFFERLIGWSLLILFINTLSRVMIRY